MKHLHETFTDQEFEALKCAKEKSGKNWHDFLLGILDYHPYEEVKTE